MSKDRIIRQPWPPAALCKRHETVVSERDAPLHRIGNTGAHAVITMALSRLFSIEKEWWESEPVAAYAQRALPAHLLAIGNVYEAVRVLSFLSDRLRPAETRDRWLRYLPQILEWVGPTHPIGLEAREHAAMSLLFADELTVYGERDRRTLTTGVYLARYLNRAQRFREGLELVEWLLPIVSDLLGDEDPLTYEVRKERASLYGVNGQTAQARAEYEALVDDLIRVGDPLRPDLLHIRINLGMWRQHDGDPHPAKTELEQVLPTAEALWGPLDPRVSIARGVLADCVGDLGDAEAAEGMWRELIASRTQVSGPEHPNTGARLNNLPGQQLIVLVDVVVLQPVEGAHWFGQAGDQEGAKVLMAQVLSDQERVLGLDHVNTQFVRDALAQLQGDRP